MANLSRAATGDFSVEQMLQSLCRVAAEALDVDGAGAMITQDGANRFVHATLDQVQPLELLQEVLQQGPCVDCLRTESIVAISDLAHADQWPEFRTLAAELSIGSVVAVPLLSRGRGWGVLDLYRLRSGAWSEDELKAAQALADIAVSYIVMAYDRDEVRTAQQALAHRAMHDDLTGLANRGLLFDRLEHALAAAIRTRAAVAVVFLDLDLFKGINDTFGHTTADAVLVEVGRRLVTTLRGSDTVARFAGDEFVVICEGLPLDPVDVLTERVLGLVSRVQRALEAPVGVGHLNVTISASIGIAITTEPVTAQELIADADSAMYTSKQSGRGQVSVHDRTAASAIAYTHELERDLGGALDRRELRVHYQPIFAADTGHVAAVEALLRWDQPHDGVLPAAAFIDIAVRSGMINRIGRWVIDQTCGQMSRWQLELGARAPATAFINLSSRELADTTLPDVIQAQLAHYGLRPEQIGLEIVEDDLADPAIISRLETYRARGHPLSVDDFGTGYSSLSRLLDLPVHYAKIDKAFVAGIPVDRRRTRLIDAVLLMASRLDLQVVAEGVETADQLQHLTDVGCHLLQGYHLARPQAAAELTAILTR